MLLIGRGGSGTGERFRDVSGTFWGDSEASSISILLLALEPRGYQDRHVVSLRYNLMSLKKQGINGDQEHMVSDFP